MERIPLAERMRPKSLDEVIGQGQLLGDGELLRRIVAQGEPVSLIFWGPPGTGKTTLARIIACEVNAEFIELSAVTSGKKDVEKVIEHARQNWNLGLRTILFVDEIHRFNKAQQDAFLPHVESGLITLIGATTENPSFEVIPALLSRTRVLVLQPLAKDEIIAILKRALKTLGKSKQVTPKALDYLAELSGGDARVALGNLELALGFGEKITPDIVKATAQKKIPGYDKKGDMHYDVISAFIKSLRGSDVQASLYYLSRMIDAGEDPKFIARRIMILASEDIGNADPEALLIAEAAFRSAEVIGYPECRINLAQAVLYMALAPKSNAAEAGIDAALAEVRKGPRREVPPYLRDRHRPGSDEYGAYLYPHNYPGGWVEQRYLPKGLSCGAFFSPSDRGWEAWRLEAIARDRGETTSSQTNKKSKPKGSK